MVKRELEQEVIEVLKCIQGGQNFILEGGAGSGKHILSYHCSMN